MKKFECLLKSEIKKVEKFANKITGFDDCKLTAYSYKITHPFSFDPDCAFVDIDCEICRDYEEPIDALIHLSIMMNDRRKTYAWCMVNGEYVSSRK